MPSLTMSPVRAELVIAAILDVLSTDPDIANAGVSIVYPDGDRENSIGVNPRYETLPIIKMMQTMVGSKPLHENQVQWTVTVEFELWVKGSHYADPIRMAYLLQNALSPPIGAARWQYVHDNLWYNTNLQVKWHVVTTLESEHQILDPDQSAQKSKAVLSFTLEVDGV